MTENNNEVNKNIDANIINESMHTVPEGGILSSNGYIAPTIGRPNKSCWFMSHPTYEQTLTIAQGSVGAGGQPRTYLVQGVDMDVHQKIVEALDTCYLARVVLTCSTSGHHTLWPMKLSTEENKHIAHTTAGSAWEASKLDFIKLWYGGNDIGYEWKHPENSELFAKKKPDWPEEQTWPDMLGKGFKQAMITDLVHPVYLSAIGKIV